MNRKFLFALWGALLTLCAGLGFLPEPEGITAGLLTAAAVAAFIPPALLLLTAKKAGDRRTAALIRNLAASSLVLTAMLLIANFASFSAPESLGRFLYSLLVILSAPMICSGHWALSLFLWAFLMIWAVSVLKKK